MYKDAKKTEFLRRYMKVLSLHTGAHTVQWEYNTCFIAVVGAKRVTPRLKHIYIPVCYVQEQFDNVLFLQKYDNSIVMPSDVCTKPCSGPIIIRSTKWMTGFGFYPTSETEHYKFMRLHEFIVK